jgi:hypothetical protein
MPQLVKITDGVESTTHASGQARGFIGWSPSSSPTVTGLAASRGKDHALPANATDQTKQHYRGGVGQGDPTGATAPS